MAGRSPPGPFRCGSTTWSVNPAATAASNALPPCSSTAIPAADASQCVEATMPKVPRSSGRVVNTPRKVLVDELLLLRVEERTGRGRRHLHRNAERVEVRHEPERRAEIGRAPRDPHAVHAPVG